MEDWSDAASDNIQVTDCRDHRGEDLPQVRLESYFHAGALFGYHCTDKIEPRFKIISSQLRLPSCTLAFWLSFN